MTYTCTADYGVLPEYARQVLPAPSQTREKGRLKQTYANLARLAAQHPAPGDPMADLLERSACGTRTLEQQHLSGDDSDSATSDNEDALTAP